MTGIYGVNLTGLKRQPTFDEVIGIENFKPKYPDRRNKFLRNSPMMTQFDNIGAFELEEYYNREMVQRQMHDLISSIAKSSDLTFNEVKTISKGIGKISPKFDTGTRVDMGEARAELEEEDEDAERERLRKLETGKVIFLESFYKASPTRVYIGSEIGDPEEGVDQPGAAATDTESESDDSQEIIDQPGAAAAAAESESGAAASSSKRTKPLPNVPENILKTNYYISDNEAQTLGLMKKGVLVAVARFKGAQYSTSSGIMKKQEILKSIVDSDRAKITSLAKARR